MRREIYYFTGTGNSFVVARDIADKINAKLIPMASIFKQDCINSDADIIGFIFPIYDFKPPKPVMELVEKFKNINSKYIFAVTTYGIIPSNAIKVFKQLIRSAGGELSSGFAVKMPHNGLGSSLYSQAQREIMFNDWKVKLEFIGKHINDGKKGTFETSDMLFSLIFSGLLTKMLPFMIKLIKQVRKFGWKSLALIADEKCDGCGICKKICPVDNIEIIDGKPSWSDHCAGCAACFHWCPKDALRFGNTDMNIKQYHHPETGLTDMMKQKM